MYTFEVASRERVKLPPPPPPPTTKRIHMHAKSPNEQSPVSVHQATHCSSIVCRYSSLITDFGILIYVCILGYDRSLINSL